MDKFENLLDYKFKDKQLLKTALTHRSYVNENFGTDNEKLEFLGDAVLQLVVTDFLYEKYPDFNEGMLSSYRSALVDEKFLVKVANDIDIAKYMNFSKARDSILSEGRDTVTSDAIEALIGALYIDGGIKVATKFIDKFIHIHIDLIGQERLWIDSKTYLQNKSQELLSLTPHYLIVKESGSDHDKKFIAAVYVGDNKIAEGLGDSKKKAEKDAAEVAIKLKNW